MIDAFKRCVLCCDHFSLLQLSLLQLLIITKDDIWKKRNIQISVCILYQDVLLLLNCDNLNYTPNSHATHTTPWPHLIIDVGLVQIGYSIPSPVLLKCCVASVVA